RLLRPGSDEPRRQCSGSAVGPLTLCRARVFDFCWHSAEMSAKNFSDTPCASPKDAHLGAQELAGGPRQRPKTKLLQYSRRTAMKFRPLHDRVVVKRIDADQKTAGGIIIPDTAQEKP